MSVNAKMTAIADAIRGKTGKTDSLTLEQMATEIAGIETGGGEDYLAQRLTNTLTHYENNEIDSIESYSFYGCNNLVNVSFSKVHTINGQAFRNCTKLESVYFPSLKSLFYSAFRFCRSLKEFVVLNPQTRAVGGNGEAFSDCNSLEKVDINIDKIDDRFFYGCVALNAVILRRTDSITINGGIYNLTNTPIANGTGYIYVPSALLEEYKAATNWSVYADQFRAIEGSEYE